VAVRGLCIAERASATLQSRLRLTHELVVRRNQVLPGLDVQESLGLVRHELGERELPVFLHLLDGLGMQVVTSGQLRRLPVPDFASSRTGVRVASASGSSRVTPAASASG
jgi:hypothetical protein